MENQLKQRIKQLNSESLQSIFHFNNLFYAFVLTLNGFFFWVLWTILYESILEQENFDRAHVITLVIVSFLLGLVTTVLYRFGKRIVIDIYQNLRYFFGMRKQILAGY